MLATLGQLDLRLSPPQARDTGCSYLQGKEVIEFYLNELISQEITHIPRWTPGGSEGYSPISGNASRGYLFSIDGSRDDQQETSTPGLVRGEPGGHNQTSEPDGKSRK